MATELDSDAAPRWTLIKGQISKLLTFDIRGSFKKYVQYKGGWRGVGGWVGEGFLKGERKWTEEGGSNLSLHSLCEKIARLFKQ